MPSTQNPQTEPTPMDRRNNSLEESELPSIDELLKIIVVQQQRIYDVLLILLNATNKEDADALLVKHSEFGYIGPLPWNEIDS